MQFLVWNLNEETGVFWSDLTILDDNGGFDPWGRKFSPETDGKAIKNRYGEIVKYQIFTEIQGYPVEMLVLNE